MAFRRKEACVGQDMEGTTSFRMSMTMRLSLLLEKFIYSSFTNTNIGFQPINIVMKFYKSNRHNFFITNALFITNVDREPNYREYYRIIFR